MDIDKITKELGVFLGKGGFVFKDIRCITDADLSLVILSVRVSGNLEVVFYDNNAELLRAVSVVFQEMCKKKFHCYKNIIIDINQREIDLINETKSKAQMAIDRVLHFNKPYEFDYLNAYQRMLIHSYVKRNKKVSSCSVGELGDRRLVISRKDG